MGGGMSTAEEKNCEGETGHFYTVPSIEGYLSRTDQSLLTMTRLHYPGQDHDTPPITGITINEVL
jgi:hypothetical protein